MTSYSSQLWRLTVVLELIVGYALSNLQRDGQGPYNVVFGQSKDCGDQNALIHFNVKLQKTTATSATFDGSITTENVTINDDIKLKSVMQQLKRTGWKDNFMVFDFGDMGVCTLIRTAFDQSSIDKTTSQIFDQNNHTVGSCDISPGEYSFSDYVLDWSGYKAFPEFTYGKYRTEHKVYYKDYEQEIACYLVYFDVVPKKNKKRTG